MRLTTCRGQLHEHCTCPEPMLKCSVESAPVWCSKMRRQELHACLNSAHTPLTGADHKNAMKNRVFDWRARQSWQASIQHYADDLLGPSVRNRIERDRPKCWSDDMSWLPDSKDVVPEFVLRFATYYSYFKGFHGCRPVTLSSYYEHVLLGQNSESLFANFRGIYSDVPRDKVDRVIEEFADRGLRERGAIWFVGDDASLIEDCGHYAIQGSEFLMALAAALCGPGTGEDYRFRLRQYGVPTILEVDVPASFIPPEQQREVATMVLSEWGQSVARRPLGLEEEPCYVVRQDIPPDCIKSHYHPQRIRDPHQGFRTYRNPAVTCDVCG
ncbi:conserved hypothetical protein [Burkholderia diffusa]|nr:conserved hypothetical protein [Burkholderia diffusa]